MSRHHPSRASIGVFGLLALIFLTVSGGPYGLEPAVAAVGGRAALWLLLLVPVFWSLPVALMAAELAATLPLLGGYYQWVREAMGEFWGFQEGWWSWLFTWVDMPLYPALCGEILRQTWPLLTGHDLSGQGTLGFVLGFIWLAALLNWCGARVVSSYAIASSLAVMAPFVFFVAFVWRQPANAALAHVAHAGWLLPGWGLALSTVMWNYSGWDNVATFAPDVRRPRRTYPVALLIAVVAIAICYLLPVAAGLRVDGVAAHWTEGYLVQLGAQVLGPRTAILMSFTALASAWAQYTSQLLYVVPLPVSLAQAGYLPKVLARANRREVYAPALWTCTCVYSLFALAAFSRLLVADVLLYSAGLSLEFAALWILRRRVPRLESPFRIPLEGWKLAPICIAPMVLAAVMLGLAIREDRSFTLIAAGMVATGPLLYLGIKKRSALAQRSLAANK